MQHGVITKKLILCLMAAVFVLAGATGAWAMSLSNDCKATGGELSPAEKTAMAEVLGQRGKGRDFNMLADLYTLVAKDPTVIQRGSPQIQELFLGLIAKGKLDYQKNLQKFDSYRQPVGKLFKAMVKVRASDAPLGYEGVLAMEVFMMVSQAEFDEVMRLAFKKGDDPKTMLKRMTAATEVMQKIRKRKSGISGLALGALPRGGMDECTRWQLWQFNQRLIGGGPYWGGGGIESLSDGITTAEKALAKEKNSKIKALGKKVVAKMKQVAMEKAAERARKAQRTKPK